MKKVLSFIKLLLMLHPQSWTEIIKTAKNDIVKLFKNTIRWALRKFNYIYMETLKT